MSKQWNRREVLRGLAAASTVIVVGPKKLDATTRSSEQPVEIQVTSLSPHIFRLSVLPVNDGLVASIPSDGSLAQESWGLPVVRLRKDPGQTVAAGSFRLKISFGPVAIVIANALGEVIQQLAWDESTGTVHRCSGWGRAANNLTAAAHGPDA